MLVGKTMATHKKPLILISALVSIAVILTVVASGALNVFTSFQTIPATGTLTRVQTGAGGGGGGGVSGGSSTIVDIGIYSDSACTQNSTAIAWGNLTPGQNITQTVYVKNLGNANATLSMTTSNWTPENAYPSISLSWNREGTVIAPNQAVQATLTLTVAENVDTSITTFNFDIQITATAT